MADEKTETKVVITPEAPVEAEAQPAAEQPAAEKPAVKKAPAKKKAVAKKAAPKKKAVAKKKPAAKKKAAPRKRRPRLTEAEREKREALKAYTKYSKAKSRYFSFMRQITKRSKDSAALFTAISNGKTTLHGTVRREVKKFEEDFILEIEHAMPSLEAIVMNPHKFIREYAEEVPIEKAKRITPRAVKHLAQHSQNVEDILSDGTVIPKRVLNVYVDDDLAIYENRFIMTLIKRLQVFIELRYKYIQDHGDSKNSDVVEIKKEVKIGEHEYTFEGKLKMVVPSDDEGKRRSNDDILERLTSLRRRSMFLVTSPFMKELSRVPLVQDPIQQTNIIRLNYLYQDAFRLWKFISRYDELGIMYRVTQARVNFDEKYQEILNHLVLTSYFALDTEHATLAPRDIKQHTLKPVIKPGELDFDISDERFLEHGLPVKVKTRKETEAQKAARLKREKARQKAREKKALEKERARKRAEEKRRKAREKAAARKARERERARERKERARERQRLRQAEQARRRAEKEKLLKQKRAYEAMLREEARKLRLARKEVAQVAKGLKEQSILAVKEETDGPTEK